MRCFDWRYWQAACRRVRHVPRGGRLRPPVGRVPVGWLCFPLRVHRDQEGTISILSVFGIMLLAMLLGMVINSSRQADNKVRMQNAADAAAYSGGVVLARGMNSLAFTNHLLCDVFALTAYMREARDQMSASMVPDILQAWTKVSSDFQASQFPKLQALGPAILRKVPLEAELVQDFSAWATASAQLILPTLETILAEEQIPNFQRALTMTTPELAQIATNEIARQHGLGRLGMQGGGAGASLGRGDNTGPVRQYRGILWRTIADPVGGESESARRTLPVVDPVMDQVPNQQEYVERARQQRSMLSHRYLRDWNSETLVTFEYEAKMSQFRWLWEGFTCGQLERLLNDEYPNNNLLFMIRTEVDDIQDLNEHLELDFMFVGVVYCDRFDDILPGMYRNPMQHHTQTHAQIALFIPRPRLMLGWRTNEETTPDAPAYGGVPGELLTGTPPADSGAPSGGPGEPEPYAYRQSRSMQWNLLNQNWTVQLVPARAKRLNEIISSVPRLPGLDTSNLRVPNLQNLSSDDIDLVNGH